MLDINQCIYRECQNHRIVGKHNAMIGRGIARWSRRDISSSTFSPHSTRSSPSSPSATFVANYCPNSLRSILDRSSTDLPFTSPSLYYPFLPRSSPRDATLDRPPLTPFLPRPRPRHCNRTNMHQGRLSTSQPTRPPVQQIPVRDLRSRLPADRPALGSLDTQ